jgi:hypothetical protein
MDRLKVINDGADRGVKLMEDYLLTVDEGKKQDVLQAVEAHRRGHR